MDEIGITELEFENTKEEDKLGEEFQKKISNPKGYLESVHQVRDTFNTDVVAAQRASRLGTNKASMKGGPPRTS